MSVFDPLAKWRDDVFGRVGRKEPKRPDPEHSAKLPCGCLLAWNGSPDVPPCPLHKNDHPGKSQ